MNSSFIFDIKQWVFYGLLSISEESEGKYLTLVINAIFCILVALWYQVNFVASSYLLTLAHNINFDIDKCTQQAIFH